MIIDDPWKAWFCILCGLIAPMLVLRWWDNR